MTKRISLLASFIQRKPSASVALFSLSGRDLSHLFVNYSANDALTSDMVAIGQDMYRVMERDNIKN